MKLTIVICTYNRQNILPYCLDSISNQTVSHDKFEVLIIDNNSTDDTAKICENYVNDKLNFRYILETKQGLSYARNRGYLEANTNWICYIDDDAKARSNFIEIAYSIINNTSYNCFGGVYLPWHLYGKPKWFKESYGSNKMKYKKLTTLPTSKFLSGGNMTFKKDMLVKYGGFKTNLGMTGSKVAYGEETEFQMRLHSNNIKIGYSPDLIIDHLVGRYKLNVDWYIKSNFSLGRDQLQMGLIKNTFFNLFKNTLIGVFLFIFHLIYYTPKLFFKNYYIENWLIDILKKAAKRAGFLYTAILTK